MSWVYENQHAYQYRHGEGFSIALRVMSGIMNIVLFPANVGLHIICIRFPPLKVHGVDV